MIHPHRRWVLPVSIVLAGMSLVLQWHGTRPLEAAIHSVESLVNVLACATSQTEITPCTSSQSTSANSSGSKTFTVTNKNRFEPVAYFFSCTVVSPVTSCTPPADVTIPANSTRNVTATYTTGASGGTGSMTFVAEDGMIPVDARVDVTVPQPITVAVTPDGRPIRAEPNSMGNSQSFTVTNSGASSQLFNLTATCTGTAVCTSSPSSVTVAASSSAAVAVQFTVGAGGTTGTVRLRATSSVDGSNTDEGYVSLTVNSYTVAVSPDSQSVVRFANSGVSESFTVRNSGNQMATYVLTTLCSGTGVTSCVAPTNIVIAAGDSSTVSVTYSTGSPGTTGEVRLRAAGGGYQDDGWILVTAGTAATPAISLVDVNPATALERDLCLTIAAGSDAAYECGDLRIVHSLPTTRTVNRTRAPILLYNSQHAHPYPLIAANVGLSSTGVTPDSVVATLSIASTIRASGRWLGTDWRQGRASRIVLGFDGLNDPTGVYAYTLEVANWYGGTRYPTTATDQLIIVNRNASPFGAGWWLAGLEQLFFPPSGGILWVGGDGSARLYASAGVDAWVAPNVDRPDTLKREGSTYVRLLRHGLKVRFASNGEHSATEHRLGYATTFTHVSGRLTGIALPPAGSGKSYAFAYDGNGRLQTVTAPPAGAVSRITTLTMDAGGRVSSVQDPDAKSVGFGYDPAFINRISSRTDRRGTVTTYNVDLAKRLSQVSTDMGPGQSAITRTFRAGETRGLPNSGSPSAVDTADAYALIDGPRTDVADTTQLWIDRFGSPRKIRDALGNQTVVDRADSRWPALATRVRYANGRVVSATYDTRGNVVQATDSSVYQGGEYATTRYEWDTAWDFVTKIVPPERDSSVFSYDGLTGNRLWQQDASGPASRVSFSYYPSGAYQNLLAVIDPPGTEPPDSLYYDAVLGNLSETRSSGGLRTTYLADGLGRDTLVRTPVDPAQTKREEQRIAYDLMDRDTLTRHSGPSESYSMTYLSGTVAAHTTIVRKFFDAEGNLDSLHRKSDPDPNGIGWIKTAWRLDRAGRTVKEIAPDGRRDSMVYDPAGNQTRWITRRDTVITMAYDALNRLAQRISPPVFYRDTTPCEPGAPLCRAWYPGYGYGSGLTIPADTATFGYDAVGNLVAANNRYARITRTHHPNGTLETDTLRIREYDPQSTDFSKHVYGLKYGYDRNGRRTWLKHPLVLAPRRYGSSVPEDSTAWRYDVVGRLQSVRDPLGNEFRYTFDYLNRPDSLHWPGGVYAKYAYDTDGRRIRRREYTAAGLLHDDTLAFDARGKITRASALITGGSSFYETVTNWYAGFGPIIASERRGETRTYDETWSPDALGNWYETKSMSGSGGVTHRRYTFQTGAGRLVNWWKPGNTAFDFDSLQQVHDPAGNIYWYNTFVTSGSNPVKEVATHHYYGADQKLMVSQRLTWNLSPGVFEEYRYDALGRRILLRARRDSTCAGQSQTNSACYSTIERTVWDGDQVLYEIRYPGSDTIALADLERDTVTINAAYAPYGRVVYTHGPGIDQPLSVIRMGYSIGVASIPEWYSAIGVMPHNNWRGLGDVGTYDDGTTARCKWVPEINRDECITIDWPADPMTVFYEMPPRAPRSWFGHLIQENRDGSEQLYKRNRYYDPTTGRFTQEDPIGLAGGLNLYGFANGDPVNYSDPFGLCPPKNMAEVLICTGQLLEPAQGPLEVAGALAIAPLAGGMGMAGGISAEVLALGSTLRSGAGSGILMAGGVAQRVAGAVGGKVSQLAKSDGFKVTVEAGKNIVARIKASGEMRVGIDRIGSLTREGLVSSNKALTHLRNLSSQELIDLVNKAKQLVGAAK